MHKTVIPDSKLWITHPFPLISPIVLQAIALLEEFRGLDRDVEGSAKQWRKWVESEYPEKEKLPQEWKKKSFIQKLIILRAMRPDRMTYALRCGHVQVAVGGAALQGFAVCGASVCHPQESGVIPPAVVVGSERPAYHHGCYA